jgi:hypothetical protein
MLDAASSAHDAAVHPHEDSGTLDAAAAQPMDAAPVSADAETDAALEPAVSFEVTTKPLVIGTGMSFQPRNIVAIWVEDAGTKPIKVLCVLAGIMRTRLAQFNARFPVTSFGTQPTWLTADVVTGATQRAHGTRRAAWYLTDLEQRPVPDGRYTMFVEVTDRNDRTAVLKVPFEVSDQPALVVVPESVEFGEATLRYDPAKRPK